MASTAWRNWAGTEHAVAASVRTPSSTDELCAAVTEAKTAGHTVRARGSGHSFTGAAACHGVALDLSRWTGIVEADSDSGLVTVRSGTPLRELNAELDRLGLAMANLGDIDAQTIAGAISTGTHGTGAGLGGIATQVTALELVRADGTLVRCSRDERPDLFDAARVSVGALGVLTSVTLQTVPSFVLEAQERPEPLERVLETIDDEAARNDHFEFYWFPYGPKALVKRNNRVPAGTPARPMNKARQYFEYEIMENKLFGLLCRAGRAVPKLVQPLNKISSQALSARTYSDVSHRVFVTSRSVRFVESEYAVPRDKLREVLDELRARVAKLADPVMFPVEVRVAAADAIWLSTAYQRDSAYIAIHQYVGMPYREYFDAFESIVGQVGGRPHWGKMHTLGAADLRERYPRFDDFLKVRAELDPEGRFANPYTDRVFGPA